MERGIANSFEVFVADDGLEGGAFEERTSFDDLEFIGESGALESETVLECVIADSFEVFVADDPLEGGAGVERQLFDDFELIGENDTREGGAFLECSLSYIRNVAVLTEYHFH